jgi:16S rRNA (uracil1498-N3)-methyltransferase
VPPSRDPVTAAAARDRFFVARRLAVGDIVELHGGDARKIALVLRKRSGDPLELTDSTGRSFAARVTGVEGAAVRALVETVLDDMREPAVEIVLAQGIPKGQKMDFVVEKATELGVARIVPLQSERVIGERRDTRKVERWRRLALAAAQQSGRQRVPGVDEPAGWEEVLASFPTFDAVLLPWELAPLEPLRTRLPALLAGRRVLVIVGPEGGFSHDEASRAIEAGAHPLSLGKRIFRTETAALVLLSAILYDRAEL